MQFDAKAVCILNRLLSLLFIYYLVLGEITAFRHHGFGPSHYRQLIDLSSVAGSALLLPIWSNSCPFQLLTRYLITDPRDDPSLAGERAWPKQEIAASLSLHFPCAMCTLERVSTSKQTRPYLSNITRGRCVTQNMHLRPTVKHPWKSYRNGRLVWPLHHHHHHFICHKKHDLYNTWTSCRGETPRSPGKYSSGNKEVKSVTICENVDSIPWMNAKQCKTSFAIQWQHNSSENNSLHQLFQRKPTLLLDLLSCSRFCLMCSTSTIL